ncbi:MAG TPA: ribosome-associated translation inhibitor RaiA [Bryobacteraceae bacterium]
MKITYTGRHEVFPPKQKAKLEAKLQKLSKMLERKGEKEAHVILSQERFLHKIEITMNAWDHALVGVGSDRDLIAASSNALDKLEKQLRKVRDKWLAKRHKDNGAAATDGLAAQSAAAPPKNGRAKQISLAAGKRGSKKVFRVNNRDGNKPMTLEEAMLEMEVSQDYMVYRDSQTDRVAVLMRRSDGHFDLIES